MNIDNYKTIANNILIAEFMNIEQNDGCFLYDAQIGKEYIFAECLEYNDNWNWLMKVVEQIEQFETVDVDILQYGTKIHNYKTGFEYVNNIGNISFNNKIDHTYNAVVEFITNLDNNIKNF